MGFPDPDERQRDHRSDDFGRRGLRGRKPWQRGERGAGVLKSTCKWKRVGCLTKKKQRKRGFHVRNDVKEARGQF